jgi:hypothetical protein
MDAPFPLPFRGADGAPHFDGTPIHLERFFDDIDQVYDLVSGTPPTLAERIRQCKYYLDNNTFMLWNVIEAPAGTPFTWESFKAAIRDLYPECDRAHWFSVQDLECLVSDAGHHGIHASADLGEYYQEFTRIATHLRQQNRIAQGKLDRLYIKGFGPTTHAKIERRLEITQPNHHLEDPHSMADVHTTATFVLSYSPTSPSATPTTLPALPVSLPSSTPLSSQHQIICEAWDMDSFMTGIHRIIAQNMVPPTRAYHPPSWPNNNFAHAGPLSNRCYFCGRPHCRIATCPAMDEYQRAGMCIRNEQGRVCLPSGCFVPSRVPGTTLKERFDHFYAVTTGSIAKQPTVPAMMSQSVEMHIAEEDSNTGHEARLDSGDMELPHHVLAHGLIKNEERPAPKSKPTVEIHSAKPASSPAAPRPHAPIPPESADHAFRPSGHEAQYGFESPLENPAIIYHVLDKPMDIPITLSQCELLTVSPDLCRKMENHTAGHHSTTPQAIDPISTQYFEDDHHTLDVFAPDTPPLTVAKDSLPLCTLSGLLDGRLSAECVIDNGTSIVAMRRDLWEQLGTALCANSAVNM